MRQGKVLLGCSIRNVHQEESTKTLARSPIASLQPLLDSSGSWKLKNSLIKQNSIGRYQRTWFSWLRYQTRHLNDRVVVGAMLAGILLGIAIGAAKNVYGTDTTYYSSRGSIRTTGGKNRGKLTGHTRANKARDTQHIPRRPRNSRQDCPV